MKIKRKMWYNIYVNREVNHMNQEQKLRLEGILLEEYKKRMGDYYGKS
jgi:hypothetical protein